jgi:hypothetical protein
MPFVALTLDGAQMAARDDHSLASLGHDRCNVHLAKINTRGHDMTEQGWVCDPCINGQGKLVMIRTPEQLSLADVCMAILLGKRQNKGFSATAIGQDDLSITDTNVLVFPGHRLVLLGR